MYRYTHNIYLHSPCDFLSRTEYVCLSGVLYVPGRHVAPFLPRTPTCFVVVGTSRGKWLRHYYTILVLFCVFWPFQYCSNGKSNNTACETLADPNVRRRLSVYNVASVNILYQVSNVIFLALYTYVLVHTL